MVIDAHQHFWDISKVAYPWLTPALAPIYKTFSPHDLEPLLLEVGVTGTVLVQAANGFEDTRAMLENADQYDWIKGMVGWIPLTEPQIAERALEVFVNHKKFRGVRHLIHDEPDADYLLKPAVLESLRLLAKQNLSFDVVGILPRHLEIVSVVAAKIPHLKIVIDHLCKPDIQNKTWQPWADLLQHASQLENVYAKISGLNTASNWENWSAKDIEPYVFHALECFGANRLMFGSDYPVALLAGDYRKVWSETNAVLEQLSASEKMSIFGQTAINFYQLEN